MLEDLLYDPQRVLAVHTRFRELHEEAEAATEKVRACEMALFDAERNLEQARSAATNAREQFDDLQTKINKLGLRSATAWREGDKAWDASLFAKESK